MHYVIAGGSIAGLSALSAIREADPGGEVTLLCGERAFYYRPMIPLVLEGARSAEEIAIPDERLGISGARVLYDTASSLDPVKRTVGLSSGGSLGFDRLLIATGGVPVSPSVPGAESAYTLRTLDDALKLKKACSGAKSAVVLGGGFVGIKAALSLRRLGLGVAVVERLNHILSPRLDETGAGMVARRLEGAGVRVLAGDEASEVREGGVRLASGGDIPADVVVSAVGVRANTGWLEGSGVETDIAVVVDERLMTSAEGVYAAGDVAQGRDIATGRMAASALWTNAVDMGRAAGRNMAGGKEAYRGFLQVMNSVDIEGLPVMSVGAVAEGSGEEFESRGGGAYRKLVFRDDVLIGAAFVGDVKNAGIYANLIRSGAHLGELKGKAVRKGLVFADFVAVS